MAGGVWGLLRGLRLRVLGPEREQVGLDHLGNKYFRVPKHQTWAGHVIAERRFMEAEDKKEYEYEVGDIPTEWDDDLSKNYVTAWIRKRRKDPPTIEEILKNEIYKEEMQRKIKEFNEKDKLLQTKDDEEGLVEKPVQTQIKGHASTHHYGKDEPSEDPVSTANTFQPGSWMPPQANGQKK